MLGQDQGLLLGQGHQPFGVSQLWVLGLLWQDLFIFALCLPAIRVAAPVAGPFAAGLSTRLRGSPSCRALSLGAGFAAAPFSFSLTLSTNSAPQFFFPSSTTHAVPPW